MSRHGISKADWLAYFEPQINNIRSDVRDRVEPALLRTGNQHLIRAHNAAISAMSQAWLDESAHNLAALITRPLSPADAVRAAACAISPRYARHAREVLAYAENLGLVWYSYGKWRSRK